MSKPKQHSGFAAKWASQTSLGVPFGLSAVAVGRMLAEAGVRDPATKAPTAQALADGWATSTPLRDGRPHYMWSRAKASALFQSQRALSEAEIWANELRARQRTVARYWREGEDKLACLMSDGMDGDVPNRLRAEVFRLLEG